MHHSVGCDLFFGALTCVTNDIILWFEQVNLMRLWIEKRRLYVFRGLCVHCVRSLVLSSLRAVKHVAITYWHMCSLSCRKR